MARVGVDIDGVLFPFEDAFREYLVKRKGWRPYECPPATRWEFYIDWDLTPHMFVRICDEAADRGELFRHHAPYPEVAAQLQRLRDARHKIILITSRDFGADPRIDTEWWLYENDIPYDELHFTQDKTKVPVDYHIDDNVDNHLAMLDAKVTSWLLARPWNTEGSAFYRLDSLEEYVDVVLADQELRDRAADMVSLGRSTEERVTSSTGGQKGRKPAQYGLIPPDALRQVAELYGKGAAKYAPYNWRKGYPWSLSFDAMQRHAWQFWDGEEYDSETGCAHLASVAFHALTLLTFMEEQREHDDRFKRPE